MARLHVAGAAFAHVMIAAFFAVAFLLLSVYAAFLLRVREGLRTYDEVRNGPLRAERVEPFLSVTVVVPMRNEAANAASCVRSLGSQDYPSSLLECIIADDGSEDGTADIVSAAISGDPRFRLLSLRDGAAGKKAAIETAVAASRGDLILTTDADCTHDPGWVAAMAAEAGRGFDVVAGPVLYDPSTTVFERMQALEFLGLVGVGAG
ncbi:MAG: glycosyltransferase, partial [Bacteroidota bacterium]|nr:glycosyltransferase [Bacteroidota bacterium]